MSRVWPPACCSPLRSASGSSLCAPRTCPTTSSPHPLRSRRHSALMPGCSRARRSSPCARYCWATCSPLRSRSRFAVLLHFSAVLRRALLPILVLSQTVPDGRARAGPRDPARLRDRAETGRGRDRLLLPDRRQRGRRAALNRSRTRADDAHAARRPVRDLPPRRVPRCAARDLLRRADRSHLRRGRSGLRRVGGLFVRARLRHAPGPTCARHGADLRRRPHSLRDRACPLRACHR